MLRFIAHPCVCSTKDGMIPIAIGTSEAERRKAGMTACPAGSAKIFIRIYTKRLFETSELFILGNNNFTRCLFRIHLKIR